jgi:hypothetical protein
MNIYRKWIDKNEFKGFATHADIKTKHDFNWGLEYLGIQDPGKNPFMTLTKFNENQIKNSKSFFVPPVLSPNKYQLTENILTFPSSIITQIENNNLVRMQYYPSEDKENIIIVVPHWNASGSTYNRICLKLQKIGFTSLRVILPYHDERGSGEIESSTNMVSANVGRTINAMQQSIQDILSSVNWLENQGYKRIGVMGSSIGSCSGFIAACHDPRINGFFANLMSSYYGDVVWTGLSTKHIKLSYDIYNQSCEKGSELSQDMIRESFILNSPIAFVDKINFLNPTLKLCIMSGRYDTTFLFKYTKQILQAFDEYKIKYRSSILPCGHYSLGKFWFQYIDAFYIYTFFKSLFMRK